MKKFLLALGFLGSALHLCAVNPVPFTEAVTFSCKLAVTGTSPSGGCYMTVLGEYSAGVGGSANAGESSVSMAWLRPGKEYDVTYSATAGGTGLTGGEYWLSLVAPKGYAAYLDGVQVDLIHETFSTPTSPTYVADTHKLVLRPLAGGAAAAGSFSGIELGESVAWDVGVGGLRTGRSAGRIIFREQDLTTSPASRARLYYTPPSNNGQIQTANSGGALWQVGVPQTIVQIDDDISLGGYWMKFYLPTDGTWNSSTHQYDLTGTPTPWRTIRVESPGTSQLKITETEGSAVRVSSLALTSGSVSSGTYVWTLQEGDGSTWLRTTTHTSTNNGGSPATRDDIVVVRTLGASGAIVAKTKYHYVTQTWGEEITQVIADPDTAALTTTYAYFTSSSAAGNYRQVQSVTDPTGNWVSYLYYDDWDRRGQVQIETRPYVDTPGTVQSASLSTGNSVSHDYVADFSGRKRLESDAVNKITNVQTGHTVTAPTLAQTRNSLYYTVTQTDAYANSTDYVRTIAEVTDPASGSSTDYSFLPYTVKRADQSQDAYAHFLGTYSGTTFTVSGSGTYFRTNVWHGSTNSSGATSFTSYGGVTVPTINLIANKSTMDVTIQDPAGNVARRETHVYTGGTSFTLLNYEDFTYDGAGRLTQRVASNGATVDYHYANGRQDYTVDAAGTRTEFTYDLLGRVATTVKKGASAYGTYAAQGDITTTLTYDGASRVTQTQTTGGTHTLTAASAYDLAGRATSSTAPGSYTTSYAYTSSGKIVTTTLPGGGTKVTETYLDGQLKQVSGSAVVAENYNYWIDGSALKSRSFYPGGNTSQWTNSYADWLGRPNQEWKPAWSTGYMTKYWYYNSSGQLNKFTQPGLADTLYEYDTLGAKTRVGLDIGANGALDLASSDRITEYDSLIWTGGGNWWLQTITRTYATAGSGTVTTLTWTDEQLSGFSGGVQQRRYPHDIFGNVTEQTTTVDRTNKKVTVTTDTPDSTTNAVQVTYNGLAAEATDTVGVTMKYGYDDLGRPVQSIDPRTGTTTTAYVSGTSQAYTVTDPASVVQVTYAYDSAGRVATVATPNPHYGVGGDTRTALYARYGYNDRNQKVHEWGDTGYPVEYTYDTQGRQTQLTTYASSTATFTGSTWPTSPNNPQTTTWTFNSTTGFLSSKTDAASHVISYTYTSAGQLYQITNARSNVTTNAYSSTTGELTGVSYSDGTTSLAYTYNRLGQVATVDDATGTRTFTYGLSGTLELQYEQVGSSFYGNYRITRGYDTATGKVGRYNRLSVGTSSTPYGYYDMAYAYDSDGRLNQAWNFQYGYLSNSNLLNSVSDTGSSWTQSRSYLTNRNLLDTIETKWSATSTSVAKFDYSPQDSLGRVTDVTKTGAMFEIYGDGGSTGLTTYYDYNDRSELNYESTYTTVSGSPVGLTGRWNTFAYDNLGNRQSALHNGDTATYTSNSLNQYSQRDVVGIFDIAGGASSSSANVYVNGSTSGVTRQGKYYFKWNSLTNTSNPVYTTFGVSESPPPPPPAPLQLPAFVAKTPELFTYDDDGNLLTDGRWDYFYNAKNQLTGASTISAAWTAGVTPAAYNYYYDYLGRRVRKQEYTWSGSAWVASTDHRYLYDGWNLLYELDGSLTQKTAYIWGLDWSGTLQGAGGVGGLLACYDYTGGNWYSPAYDGNGNVMAMIKASDGSIAAAYEYDTFGNTLRESGPYAASNPFRYSTKYTDIESGLVYYGRRYYSPGMGRFINRDPIEESGGLNLYGFCRNNGVNGYDYLGMDGNPYSDVDFNPANRRNPDGHVQAGFAWLDDVVRTSLGNSPGSRPTYDVLGLPSADSMMYAGDPTDDPYAMYSFYQEWEEQNKRIASHASSNNTATTPAPNNDPKNNQDTATGQTRTETDPKTGKTYIVTNDPNYDPTGMTLVAWGTNYGSFSNGSVVRGGSNAGMVGEQNGVLGTIGANNTWSSGGTLVMIGYRPVAAGEYHSFTIAIDLATGEQFIGRGGPASTRDGYFATSLDPWGSIWGQTRTWTENPNLFDTPSITTATQFVGATSASYSTIKNQMSNFAQSVNQNPTLYWPFTSSCNAYNYTQINYLGFTPPTPMLSVPGWGVNITH